MRYRLRLTLTRLRGGPNGWEEELSIYTKEPFSIYEEILEFAEKRLDELNEQARQYNYVIWEVRYMQIEKI